MKRAVALTALICALSAAASAQPAARATTTTGYQRRLEQQFMRLDEELARAVQRADQRALERLLADDFSSTDADGETQDKRQYIADLVSGARKLTSVSPEGYLVRAYGDTALVNHGGTTRGEYRGRDTGGRYRWTHIFVRRGGRWRCVSTQVTREAQQRPRPR